MDLVVSLAAAACTVAVMEHWLRAAGLRHNAWLAAGMLCTTWLFAHTAFSDASAMLTTLFATLSLSNFFFTRFPEARPSPANRHLPAPFLRGRGWLPVWLFASMLFGGPAGLAVPLTGIAAFVITKREWRRTGEWIGLREALIFSVLCLIWVEMCYTGGALFTPAPDEHLFWYLPRLLRDFLPWTPVCLIVLTLGVWRKKLRSDIARFLYTSIWANIVVMSLIACKSEVYLLPIYPLTVYLTATLLRKRHEPARVRL